MMMPLMKMILNKEMNFAYSVSFCVIFQYSCFSFLIKNESKGIRLLLKKGERLMGTSCRLCRPRKRKGRKRNTQTEKKEELENITTKEMKTVDLFLGRSTQRVDGDNEMGEKSFVRNVRMEYSQ